MSDSETFIDSEGRKHKKRTRQATRAVDWSMVAVFTLLGLILMCVITITGLLAVEYHDLQKVEKLGNQIKTLEETIEDVIIELMSNASAANSVALLNILTQLNDLENLVEAIWAYIQITPPVRRDISSPLSTKVIIKNPAGDLGMMLRSIEERGEIMPPATIGEMVAIMYSDLANHLEVSQEGHTAIIDLITLTHP